MSSDRHCAPFGSVRDSIGDQITNGPLDQCAIEFRDYRLT